MDHRGGSIAHRVGGIRRAGGTLVAWERAKRREPAGCIESDADAYCDRHTDAFSNSDAGG